MTSIKGVEFLDYQKVYRFLKMVIILSINQLEFSLTLLLISDLFDFAIMFCK